MSITTFSASRSANYSSYTSRCRSASLLGLWLLLSLSCLLVLCNGVVNISPGQALAILADSVGWHTAWPFSHEQQTVLLAIRAPRLVLGLLVGGSLAVSGATMQGLFRNPLADPALIGQRCGIGRRGSDRAAKHTVQRSDDFAGPLPAAARSHLRRFYGQLAGVSIG